MSVSAKTIKKNVYSTVDVLVYMKLFKKILIYSSILAFVIAILGFVFLQKAKEDERLKESALYYAKKIKNFIYYEATIHNPEGDMLPDQIDNAIISETKNILKRE